MPPLTPQQNFTVVQQLFAGDPGTYYVQSIVRYSATGAIIATLNLANQGSQRFTGSFLVPADIQGNGYYIDITTTVYTDAGHSQISQNYGTTNAVYQAIQSLTAGMGLGGTDDGLTPEVLKKILEEIVGKHVKGIKIPKFEQTDYNIILHRMENKIDGIEFPTVDFSTTHGHLKDIKEILNELPYKIKKKKYDISPIVESLKNIEISVADAEAGATKRHKDFISDIKEKITDIVIEDLRERLIGIVKQELGKTTKAFNGFQFLVRQADPIKPAPKPIEPVAKKLVIAEERIAKLFAHV